MTGRARCTPARRAQAASARRTRASGACDDCLRRAWLLARLASHLEVARAQIATALELPDRDLIEAVAGRRGHGILTEYERFEASTPRERATAAGIELLCRCDERYPARLRSTPAPPAVLHVAGDPGRLCELLRQDPVAVVGARGASDYGLEAARSLARGLAAAGIPIVSGMAFGVDSAALAGALEVGGDAIAVLAAGAERPYPRAKLALYRRIRGAGAVISELPPGTSARRWMFPARNRIIGAAGAMTVVVEAGERSGALITAARAGELGRPVGAVPGRITSPLAAGPHRLLADGAVLVRGPQDVLDALFGAGALHAAPAARPRLDAPAEAVLREIGRGHDTLAALSRAGIAARDGLAALSSLELAGYVRREAGGRYVVVP